MSLMVHHISECEMISIHAEGKAGCQKVRGASAPGAATTIVLMYLRRSGEEVSRSADLLASRRGQHRDVIYDET